MRISVMQMSPSHDKTENIAQASALIESGMVGDYLCLPEMWSCLGGDRQNKFQHSEVLPAPDSNDAGGAVVHGGSIAERGVGTDEGRLFNTTVVFGSDGREIARYRKIHLFDIVTPGGTGYRESATFGGGHDVVTYAAGGIIVGCSICYDIRFGELFLAMRRMGAELMFVPAAFTVPTGMAHWHVLLRARAIETQSWIAAAATGGEHIDAKGERRATFGHSLICDPWGRIVAEMPDEIGIISAEVDLKATARIRRDMPLLEHRDARRVAALIDGAN